MNIGISQRIFYHNNQAYDCTEHGWYSYLSDHTLFSIPNNLNQDFQALADKLDALILTGGDDSALRRTNELKLASIMMQQFKPVLGVCHGSFLMQDVLGGTLGEDTSHLDTHHTINYFSEEINVNSFHSNIITTPHSDAKVLATDSDGNCEAWIDGNIAGIAWHPQRMETPWLPPEISNKFLL